MDDDHDRHDESGDETQQDRRTTQNQGHEATTKQTRDTTDSGKEQQTTDQKQ